MSRLQWRKAKTLAMLANKRQWERDFLPSQTPFVEIETGDSFFIATEASTSSNEIIIIAES
jgi:hypothetical protein